jgi:hypothetical protein
LVIFLPIRFALRAVYAVARLTALALRAIFLYGVKDEDLPLPLRVWFRFWRIVLSLALLAYAVSALVLGSTLGREIGAVLLILWLAVVVIAIRRYFAKPS